MTIGASAGASCQRDTEADRRSATIDVADYAVEIALGATLEECGVRLAGNGSNTTYAITDSLFDAENLPADGIWIVEPEPVPAAAAVRALASGSVAALVARSELDRLPFVLQTLDAGFAPLPQTLVASARRLPTGLTLRQHELLAHLAQGDTQDATLSRKLNCGPATVKRDISNSCDAFSLTNRRELADTARAYGYGHATSPGFLSYLCLAPGPG